MDLTETVALLTWVNQHDPRVQVNKGARDIWANALAPYTTAECRQAVLDHYRVNDDQAVSPGTIRKRSEQVRSARAGGESANQAALTAGKRPPVHPLGWRARNPELWDELFEQGRREGNEDRRRATEARAGTAEPSHESWMAA